MTLDRPLAATAAPRTFAQAADENLDAVYGYLLYLTRDHEAAEDLAGRPSRRRFASGLDSTRRGTARTWLLGIARTTALDRFAPSRAVAAARRSRPSRRGRGAFPRRALAAARGGDVDALGAEREVVALRVVLELDSEATARVLGISPTAVSTRLSRALKRLEERVSQDDRS